MDYRALLNTTEYDFLRTNHRLGSRIMLLGVSGSYGYGTNREGSDIDFRGVTLNEPDAVLTPELYAAIQDLLVRKAETEEKDLNPQMPEIIDFIRDECVRQKQISDAAPDDHRHDYQELNQAFRKKLPAWQESHMDDLDEFSNDLKGRFGFLMRDSE